MNKNVREIERLIRESSIQIEDRNLYGAIDCLEQASEIIKKHPFLGGSYQNDVLWPLGNLYGVTKQYAKAVEIEEIEINSMLRKYGITSLQNAKLPEEDASKLISLYLCLGTAYMNLEEVKKGRNQYAMGYTVAFVHFGEYDVRTLKQAYNRACSELLYGDTQEGIRLLTYCYFDMREHLGEKSEYTLKAKKTLQDMEENPDELYDVHLEMRKLRKGLCSMWEN